jgi:hypothetical protein
MAKKKLNLHKLFGDRPFNVDRQLKYKLSTSFWADSNDFLWRVGLLLNDRPHDSNAYFAKMYVDLIMSAECALKSLIISLSLSNETPEDAYSTARRIGHNLDKLYTEVEHRAKRRVKLLSLADKSILLKANTLGVNYRYDITTFFFLTQEDYIDRAFQRGLVSSVINFDFINKLYKMLHKLKDIADISYHKYYGKDNTISGKNLQKLQNRQTAFFTAMRNKL